MCLTLSEISEQSLARIEKIVEKQLLNNEKSRASNQFTSDAKKLKSLITSECKTSKPSWNDRLKEALATCKSSLQSNIQKSNEFNSEYNKKRGSISVDEEEKKLEKDVWEWSGGRFLLANGDVKVMERLPSLPSAGSAPFSVNPAPRRGNVYDKMPQ